MQKTIQLLVAFITIAPLMMCNTVQGMKRSNPYADLNIIACLFQAVEEAVREDRIDFDVVQPVAKRKKRVISRDVNKKGVTPAIKAIVKYRCNKCNFVTCHETRIVAHREAHALKKNHASILVYRCRMCDYLTTDKRRLKEHVFAHRGKKIFNCKKCNFKTKYNRSLDRHVKNQH